MRKYISRSRNIGFFNFLKYLWFKKLNLSVGGCYQLSFKDYPHKISCRKNTTDIDVFKHVFVLKEYEFLSNFDNLYTIVDCGANFGASTIFFAHTFPNSKVLALEPDIGNYNQLIQNIQPFYTRCKVFNTALWTKSIFMNVVDFELGDGREWAKAVKPSPQGQDSKLKSTDMRGILKMLNGNRISLLKIDIEGAEKEIFSDTNLDWLNFVDRIVIELHGSEHECIFLNAVKKYNFSTRITGGLTYAFK